MTMNERIEQAAEIASEKALFISPQWIPTGVDLFKQGATYALSHQWISVEDELPENTDLCFVRYKSGEFILFGTGEYEEWDNAWYVDSSGYEEVTHWMPIPPTEGGEG